MEEPSSFITMSFNLAFLCNVQLTYTPKVGWATETTGGMSLSGMGLDGFKGHDFNGGNGFQSVDLGARWILGA